MGYISLDQVHPQFRHLTDLLLFTDRTDVDWSNYGDFLKSDVRPLNPDNFYYLEDRFVKTVRALWDKDFWEYRLNILVGLKIDKIDWMLDSYIENKFRDLIRYRGAASYADNELVQYIALCKARANNKKDLITAKKLLLRLSYSVRVGKIVEIVQHFIPAVYSNLTDYGDAITREGTSFPKTFQTLRELEQHGIPINRDILDKAAKSLFFARTPNMNNRRILLTMLDDETIRKVIIADYRPEHQERLLELISKCQYSELEANHLSNIKNLLEIDSTIADKLIIIYADGLNARSVGQRKSNIERIIRVLNTFPQCSPKKLLVYLSNNNRMSDIKHLLRAFPNLKNLTPFV